MRKLTIILSAFVIVLSSLALNGCQLVTAGMKKGDERNFARSLNDINAGRAIKARMGRVEGFSLAGVSVAVAQGVVVLSGNVDRQEDRIEAERIAWSASKIFQVGNEIKLTGKQGFIRNTKDVVLRQSVRARLLANSKVKSSNYNIKVHDGIVYLLGVARSSEELALAAHTASTTRGAREIISYVHIYGDSSVQNASVQSTQEPGYQRQPTNGTRWGNVPNYTPQNIPRPSLQDYRYLSVPQPQELSQPQQLSQPQELPPIGAPQNAPNKAALDYDAIDSGEPYYLDPQTGQRVEIPEGVTPIPYVPDTPGSLGAGGAPLPPGAKPSRVLGATTARQAARQAVPGSESQSYTLNPSTGKMVPVTYVKGQWIRIYK
ncbi:MAG: BON domain-containing protein [Robiginitomaculum sp.]